MQGEYVIALAGKANRSMDRVVAHPLLQSASSVFNFSQRRLVNFPEATWRDNGNSAEIREGEMTFIAGNQIVHAGLHSATQNLVVRRIGQHLKSLAGFDDRGMSTESSDYVPDLRRRESKFGTSEDCLVFPYKKARQKKLYSVLSGEVQKQGW